jgi:antitoxin component YwqK of YwqJK toxin-antitoxin module
MKSLLKTFLLAIILGLSVNAYSEIVEKFYESGALQFKYNYLNGKLQGQSKEYYETGELKAEYVYRSGKLVSQKNYRHNGDIEYELKYQDGVKYETEISYYATGELFRQRTLVNGKREGLEIDYYRSGQKKAERNYINGKKEGSAKGFHINGKVQGDWIFENGEPIYATIFYSTGDKWLIHEDFDEHGRLNGVSKEYDKEGNLMALRYYKNNDMVKRKRVSKWWGWVWW